MSDKDNSDNTVSLQILKSILSYVNIDFVSTESLIGTEINREQLLNDNTLEKFKNLQLEIKKAGYSSCKLTSLHKNNDTKQKFPAINMMRQILKCNNLWLKPVEKSLGYNKTTGAKIVKRYFVISIPKQDDKTPIQI